MSTTQCANTGGSSEKKLDPPGPEPRLSDFYVPSSGQRDRESAFVVLGIATTGIIAYKLAKYLKKKSPIYYMHYFFLARPTSCCLLRSSTTQLDRLLRPWLPHVRGLSGYLNTSMETDKKLSARLASIYYSPRDYWKVMYALEMRLPSGEQSTEWVKRFVSVVAVLNGEVTRLTGKKPSDAIKAKILTQNPFLCSPWTPSWPKTAESPLGGQRSLPLPARRTTGWSPAGH